MKRGSLLGGFLFRRLHPRAQLAVSHVEGDDKDGRRNEKEPVHDEESLTHWHRRVPSPSLRLCFPRLLRW